METYMRSPILASLFLAIIHPSYCLYAKEIPECEDDLKAISMEMLPIEPPRTEYHQSGTALARYTIHRSGAVSDVSFEDWRIQPADAYTSEWVRRSVLHWKYPMRKKSCRGHMKIVLKEMQ
jgi:hypothetical protein